jgi:hypothetical protein
VIRRELEPGGAVSSSAKYSRGSRRLMVPTRQDAYAATACAVIVEERSLALAARARLLVSGVRAEVA